MALWMDVGPGDELQIGETVVTVERKSGSRARLRIVGAAPVELRKRPRTAAPAPPRPRGNPISQVDGS